MYSIEYIFYYGSNKTNKKRKDKYISTRPSNFVYENYTICS